MPSDQPEQAPRVVRVLPAEAAIDRGFDYLVPESIPELGLGDVVRISLQGRRTWGWVTAIGLEARQGLRLQPLLGRRGLGPSPELLELAGWAAWRWAGKRASFLKTASAPTAVTELPGLEAAAIPGSDLVDDLVAEALRRSPSTLRLPPLADPFPLALAAALRGQALVLAPSVESARHLALRLARAGVPTAMQPRDWARAAAGATVVGSRAAAWAPAPKLAAVVVLDEHDEAYQEQRAPTWHARDVALERARRAGVPCVLTSPSPSLESLAAGELIAGSRERERAGWPILDILDRREDDPLHGGLWSPRLLRMLRREGRVACILNRTGRARLLACGGCGELVRCEHCGGAMLQGAGEELGCNRCGEQRPPLCATCGGMRLARLRSGVTRAREELETLLGEPVVEVTRSAGASGAERARVYVGTEAALHQVGRVGLVAFLDFDQELLAPRYRSAEQAMALLIRASRMVGPRSGGGRVVVQTRLPGHEVLRAALLADPARLSRAELERRRALRMPPVSALAEISGAAAGALVGELEEAGGLEVLGPLDGRWLLRAERHAVLCDALAVASRPSGRVRIAVDPLRV